MDGLRWLLLLIGLLVVAGVYWYSRREVSAKKSPGLRREPSLEADSISEDVPTVVEAKNELAEGDDEPSGPFQAPPEKVVTLRIVASHRGSIAGDELALSLRGNGMRHGKFGIFHRYVGDDENDVIFSAASLVEPGSFDLAHIKDQRLPGVSLFLVLPGPVDGPEAFDLMMATARALAKSLSAELLDESGSTLSIQRERYLREEIIQYQHGIMVA
jgi:cell division protein ZipA